jgi:hypothetical protein
MLSDCSDTADLCALSPWYSSEGLIVTVRGRLAVPDGNNWLSGGLNNIYNDQVDLGMAVVHAGFAKDGELVTVRLLPKGKMQNQPSITRNGMTSTVWQASVEAFQIVSYTGTKYPPVTIPNIQIIASRAPDGEPVLPVQVPESGSSVVYVKLSAPPSEPVMVTSWLTSPVTGPLAEPHLTDRDNPSWTPNPASGNVQSLLFTPDNWNTYQTIKIYATGDSDVTNGTATFTLSGKGLAHKQYSAVEVDNDVMLTLQSSNTSHGTVSGDGVTQINTSKSIYATPKTGYKFVNWQVTSGSPTITNPTSASTSIKTSTPATIVANFTPL